MALDLATLLLVVGIINFMGLILMIVLSLALHKK